MKDSDDTITVILNAHGISLWQTIVFPSFFTTCSSPKAIKYLQKQIKERPELDVSQTALRLLNYCKNNGKPVHLSQTLIKYPQSPLPSNYYQLTVDNKHVFQMARSVIPTSDKSVKAREFFNFVTDCTLTN